MNNIIHYYAKEIDSGRFSPLSSGKLKKITNKLLRIMNALLKRIKKSEDFHMRGKLQISLTNNLTLFYGSGFHYSQD